MTYFKATFADGRTFVRGSLQDYGYTHAYLTGMGVSFTAHKGSIPARFSTIADVEKIDAKTARRIKEQGAAPG